MTLTPRTDLPTQPGWYVVLRRGVATPSVLWWGKHSPYWLEGARRVDVVAYAGPIVMPGEEL